MTNIYTFTKDTERNARVKSAFDTEFKIWNDSGKVFQITMTEVKREEERVNEDSKN